MTVGRFGDDRHVGLSIQEYTKAGAQDGVVVGQQQADLLHVASVPSGISTSRRVPRPGAESIVNVPLSTAARSRIV